jgi:hypothetical protein
MGVGVFFLTEMDPRLHVQGSRDALGGQAVWGTVGRRLVGNLTLASNDIAGFRTLLIAYALADDVASNDERLRLFLRWEQVAAACRAVVKDKQAPLGARRVRNRLAERSTMTVSEAREHQIFGDQRSSGLWMLYQRAARESGLVDRRRRLTPTGRRLTDSWLGLLPANIVTKVRKQGPRRVSFGRVGQPTSDARTVAELLVEGDGEDTAVLRQTLVEGVVPDGVGGTAPLAGGRQRRLAALLANQPEEGTWRDRLPPLQRAAEAAGDEDLADRLVEVQVAESVLHPAQVAFDALLVDGNGARPDKLAARVAKAWPRVPDSVRAREFRDAIEPLLRSAVGGRRASLWTEAGEAMADGAWERALGRMVDINADTMQQRGGAPWVRMSSSGTYDVRLPLGVQLPDEAEILDGWRNPYYLAPLLSVQRDLVTRDRL